MVFCSAVFAIARYSLPSTVLLAPMAGVTDTPWRLICQQWGAGLTTSEMLIANSALWHSDKSRLRLARPAHMQVPHSIQIVGSEPQLMAESAQQAVAYGADIVDINMGCPAKKVCKKAAGSALLKDETLVEQILTAVVAAVDVPVTLKIRTGWDEHHRNAVRIAQIAEQAGIAALAIHGRTRADRFNGDAEYDTIAEVKSRITIPVIANGDIDSVEKALRVKQHTGVDALMLGRAVQGQPWLMAEIAAALDSKPWQAPDISQKLAAIREHVEALHGFYGEHKGMGFVRKHMAFYLQHLQLSHYRATFNQINNAAAQLLFTDNLREYYQEGIAA